MIKFQFKQKLILEPTIYYVPIYCYRHWPGANDIYKYIIDALIDPHTKKHKIVLYTTKEVANTVANSMLCDDDCCAVAAFDFTKGYARCGFVNNENDIIDYEILPPLNRWSNVYTIIDKKDED